MRKYLLLILIPVIACLLFFSACKSRYEKIRTSTDLALKYKTATYYFNKRDFTRALPLLEDLNTSMKGSDKAEDAAYFYAYCEFYLKDFAIARNLFQTFAEQFPNSTRAEEARFMGAKCSMQESPVFSLDQENTTKAIEALQLFINLYPHSARITECNKMMDILRGKLEAKSFENAKLYYTIGDFKPAVIALKNSQRDFPDSKFREETEFLIIKCNYLYAGGSILAKQEDRYNETVQSFESFKENFPKSVHMKEAEKIVSDSKRDIISVRKTLQEYADADLAYQKANRVVKDSTSKKK